MNPAHDNPFSFAALALLLQTHSAALVLNHRGTSRAAPQQFSDMLWTLNRLPAAQNVEQTLDWLKLHHISCGTSVFYLPSVPFSQQNAHTRQPPEVCQAHVQEMEASGSLFAEELPGPA